MPEPSSPNVSDTGEETLKDASAGASSLPSENGKETEQDAQSETPKAAPTAPPPRPAPFPARPAAPRIRIERGATVYAPWKKEGEDAAKTPAAKTPTSAPRPAAPPPTVAPPKTPPPVAADTERTIEMTREMTRENFAAPAPPPEATEEKAPPQSFAARLSALNPFARSVSLTPARPPAPRRRESEAPPTVTPAAPLPVTPPAAPRLTVPVAAETPPDAPVSAPPIVPVTPPPAVPVAEALPREPITETPAPISAASETPLPMAEASASSSPILENAVLEAEALPTPAPIAPRVEEASVSKTAPLLESPILEETPGVTLTAPPAVETPIAVLSEFVPEWEVEQAVEAESPAPLPEMAESLSVTLLEASPPVLPAIREEIKPEPATALPVESLPEKTIELPAATVLDPVRDQTVRVEAAPILPPVAPPESLSPEIVATEVLAEQTLPASPLTEAPLPEAEPQPEVKPILTNPNLAPGQSAPNYPAALPPPRLDRAARRPPVIPNEIETLPPLRPAPYRVPAPSIPGYRAHQAGDEAAQVKADEQAEENERAKRRAEAALLRRFSPSAPGAAYILAALGAVLIGLGLLAHPLAEATRLPALRAIADFADSLENDSRLQWRNRERRPAGRAVSAGHRSQARVVVALIPTKKAAPGEVGGVNLPALDRRGVAGLMRLCHLAGVPVIGLAMDTTALRSPKPLAPALPISTTPPLRPKPYARPTPDPLAAIIREIRLGVNGPRPTFTALPAFLDQATGAGQARGAAPDADRPAPAAHRRGDRLYRAAAACLRRAGRRQFAQEQDRAPLLRADRPRLSRRRPGGRRLAKAAAICAALSRFRRWSRCFPCRTPRSGPRKAARNRRIPLFRPV